jgi:hypothetical protein
MIGLIGVSFMSINHITSYLNFQFSFLKMLTEVWKLYRSYLEINYWVRWPNACKSKKEGGMGIRDPRILDKPSFVE